MISPKFRIVLLQRIRKNCVRRKKEKARTRRRDESRETRLKKWKRECREYWISKYNESRKHCSSETKFSNTYEYCSSSSDMFAGGHGTATRKQNHRLTQLIGTMFFFVSPIIRFLNLELRYLSHERGGTNDRIVPLFSISEFFLAEKFRKKASLDRTSNSTREKYRPFVRFYFSRGRYTRIREINGKEKKKRNKKREKIKIRFDRSFLFLETAHFSRKKIFKINKSRGEKEGGGRGKARGWERRVVVEHKSNLAPPRERES